MDKEKNVGLESVIDLIWQVEEVDSEVEALNTPWGCTIPIPMPLNCTPWPPSSGNLNCR